jgi:phosphatidate cytidylyltransferase
MSEADRKTGLLRLSGDASLPARVASAIVLGPLAIVVLVLGWPWFDLLVALCAGILAWEWSRVCCGQTGIYGFGLITLMIGAALMVAQAPDWALALPLLGALGGAYRVKAAQRRPLWLAVGSLYIGIPVVCLVWIRLDTGWETVLWLFLIVWTTDSAAYVFGRLIGGARLWPAVSPNKTWAGFVGGVLSAGMLGALAAWGLGAPMDEGTAVIKVALLALLLGVVSQAGDLIESAFKRRFSVKDSSDLIPGHGGLLDRLDGLMAATPALALAIVVKDGGVATW